MTSSGQSEIIYFIHASLHGSNLLPELRVFNDGSLEQKQSPLQTAGMVVSEGALVTTVTGQANERREYTAR